MIYRKKITSVIQKLIDILLTDITNGSYVNKNNIPTEKYLSLPITVPRIVKEFIENKEIEGEKNIPTIEELLPIAQKVILFVKRIIDEQERNIN